MLIALCWGEYGEQLARMLAPSRMPVSTALARHLEERKV